MHRVEKKNRHNIVNIVRLLRLRNTSLNIAGLDCILRYDASLESNIKRLVQGFTRDKSISGAKTLKLKYLERHQRGSQNGATGGMKWINLAGSEFSEEFLSTAVYKNDLEVICAAVGVLLSSLLAFSHGVLFHGGGLVVNGKTMLLLAPSGGGKSTIISHCNSGLVLHDDKIAMRRVAKFWVAGGVPMLTNNGSTGSPNFFPVKGLYIIEKSRRLKLTQIKTGKSIVNISRQIYEPTGRLEIRRLISETLLQIASDVPIYKLHYPLGYDIAKIASKE